ncbi:beta-lactamase/transpeptidase-like protein [Dissophora ornata]|nr:beta-lactamase/transpeptidase-like protein [Dissophora ornata]
MHLPDSNQPLLAGLSEELEKAMALCGIPGMSVAIQHQGKLIYAEGFGKRNEKDPFTPETLTSIASVTKAFTATAIGELVAEGKMDWDKTPVSKYLPEFELKDPALTAQLTLIDLLSHRTGLRSLDLAWFRSKEPRRELIKHLKHVDIKPKLGSNCMYNNIMYAVAGEAAANVAGISYEELVETKVLKPLGMTHSGFSAMKMGTHANYAMPYDAASFEDAQNGRFEIGYLDDIYMADAPAGDIYSNVFDLVRWGSAVMHGGELDGKQILNQESVQETLSGHTFRVKTKRAPEFAPVEAYGLGWMLDSYKGHVVYSHSGGNPGYISHLTMFPDADLVIACLSNANMTSLPGEIPYLIADRVLGLPKTQDWVEVAIEKTRGWYAMKATMSKTNFLKRKDDPPKHQLCAYVGQYSDSVFGSVSIRQEREKGGEEVLYFKMRTFDSKLDHHHFDTFSTLLKDFGFQLGASITFRTGRDGDVEGFEFEAGADVVEFKREETRKHEE